LSIFTGIFYILFQFFVFPFVYVNPTPFKKTNPLCQKYSFLGLIYHILIFTLSTLVIVLKVYLGNMTKYICILSGICMMFLTTKLLKTQPYYNKYINYIRAGTWTMISGMSIVNFIFLIVGKRKPIFGIFFFIMGVCSFVIGVVICRLSFKHHVQGIYKRLKEKKIFDKKLFNL
ncbi:hypothetical protein BCR36DRAFT_460205, partial [Piromyces finnis]